MTSSQKTWSISALCGDTPLSPAQIGYFRARLRNAIHAEILNAFHAAQDGGLTKGDLARRLSRRPEQITRWLAAPGNWTIDTVSDLALALACEITVGTKGLAERPPANHFHELAVATTQAGFASAEGATREIPSTSGGAGRATIRYRENVDAA